MLQRQLLDGVKGATIASFFANGLLLGLLELDSAKDWAFTIVEASDEPPIEIIEVATATTRHDAVDALNSVRGVADHQEAGRLLLVHLLNLLSSGEMSTVEACLTAMRIAQSTGLPIETHIDFDLIDDELQLALDGAFGSVEDIKQTLLTSLSKWSSVAT